jgi:hypothetical protein
MKTLRGLAEDAMAYAFDRYPAASNTRAGRRHIANATNEFLTQAGNPPNVDFVMVRCGGSKVPRWVTPDDPFVVHINFHMLDGSIVPIELIQEGCV